MSTIDELLELHKPGPRGCACGQRTEYGKDERRHLANAVWEEARKKVLEAFGPELPVKSTLLSKASLRAPH
jgi:hypothetical protein